MIYDPLVHVYFMTLQEYGNLFDHCHAHINVNLIDLNDSIHP